MTLDAVTMFDTVEKETPPCITARRRKLFLIERKERLYCISEHLRTPEKLAIFPHSSTIIYYVLPAKG